MQRRSEMQGRAGCHQLPEARGDTGRALLAALAALAVAATFAATAAPAQTAAGSAIPEDPRAIYRENVTVENAVFVAVDFLTGFQPAIRTMDRYEYQNNLTGLSKMVALFGLPSIVLGDEGGGRGEFMPQMDAYFADAPFVARSTPSAWAEPAFVEAVEATGRRKLILAGISTDNCTLLTGLGALRDGYDVYVVMDVSGAESDLIQEVAMERLVAAGAVPTTWVALGSELLVSTGGWPSEYGAKLADIYTAHTHYLQDRTSGSTPGPDDGH